MATLNEAVDTVLECVCSALEDAGRPACNCYPTVGMPIWRPCCECGPDGVTGELNAFLENVVPVDSTTLQQTMRVESCRKGAWGANIAVQLSRCYPTITDDELPDPAEVAQAARDLHDDVDVIRRALTCCEDIRLTWRSVGVESDPDGGCSTVIARVMVGL